MSQAAVKKNLTIRLDTTLRKELEFIAEREMRTLANQMMVFLTRGVKDYFSSENNRKAYDRYVQSETSERDVS